MPTTPRGIYYPSTTDRPSASQIQQLAETVDDTFKAARFACTRSGAGSFPSSTEETRLGGWTSPDYNIGGFTVAGQAIQVPDPTGAYLVIASVGFAPNGTGNRWVFINGGARQGLGAGSNTNSSIAHASEVVAGVSSVTIGGAQNSGSSLPIGSVRIRIVRIG